MIELPAMYSCDHCDREKLSMVKLSYQVALTTITDIPKLLPQIPYGWHLDPLGILSCPTCWALAHSDKPKKEKVVGR